MVEIIDKKKSNSAVGLYIYCNGITSHNTTGPTSVF